MLLLFLVLLCTYNVYSQPLQENCTEAEAAFQKCLIKLSSELPDFRVPNATKDYNEIKSVFIQCGAKYSDCYLQKTLMMMIDFLPNELQHADYVNSSSCSWMLSYESATNCAKWRYNDYEFHSKMAETGNEYFTCQIEYARSQNCSEEIVEGLKNQLNYPRHEYFGYIMPLFVFNVQMKATKNDTNTIQYSGSSENCAESEKAFQACVQKEHTVYNDYNTHKTAFVECGAEKSTCYLQQHVMKMVNTVIDHSEFTEGGIDYGALGRCCGEVMKMDSKRIECEKDGYDKYGFPRADGEFGFLQWHCRAERALAEPELCIQNSVDYFKHEAVVQYREALRYFVAQYNYRRV